MPPGHPLILLQWNLFNMVPVLVKRSIRFLVPHREACLLLQSNPNINYREVVSWMHTLKTGDKIRQIINYGATQEFWRRRKELATEYKFVLLSNFVVDFHLFHCQELLLR